MWWVEGWKMFPSFLGVLIGNLRGTGVCFAVFIEEGLVLIKGTDMLYTFVYNNTL